MDLNFGKQFSGLQKKYEKVISKDKALYGALSNMEISCGLAKEPKYGTPPQALTPVYVGDSFSGRIAGKKVDAQTEALLQTNPERVNARPVYDKVTGKWTYEFTPRSVTDSPDYLAGQLFSPWNISYFSQIFKQPLSYSNFKKMVTFEQGSGSTWAEVMTLYYEEYAGWAMTEQTGSLQNTMQNDVQVINGMMSADIINLSVTYSVTLEDQQRNGQSGNPFGTQSLANTPKYARYALDLLRDVIGYYGNPITNTVGLLNVNPVLAWSRDSLQTIWDDTSVTAKGSKAYQALAGILNDFLTNADNKFDTIRIALSPQAFNILNSMPYSDEFSPQAAMKTFAENYLAGKGKDGGTPSIEFISDPLLKAGSVFNDNAFDYMVITSPSIGAGLDDSSQPLLLYGVPLDEFVFPSVPGTYSTQYKTLCRVAGVFAPVPAAVRVYSGFGVSA
jgi:hypothetical protein